VALPPGISDDGTWTRLPGPIAYEPIEHANFNREVRLPLHRAAGPDLFTRGIMTTVGKLELLLVFRDKPAHPGQRELFYLIGNRGDRKVFILQDQLAAATITPLAKPSHASHAPNDPWPARDAFALDPGEYLSYRRDLTTDPCTVLIQIPLDVTWVTADATSEHVLLSADLDLSETKPR